MSNLSLLPIYFHTTVDGTIHWPRQNYEKDHVTNVRGAKCGCGDDWKSDHTLHSIRECSWLSCMGNVICSEYFRDTHLQLNET